MFNIFVLSQMRTTPVMFPKRLFEFGGWRKTSNSLWLETESTSAFISGYAMLANTFQADLSLQVFAAFFGLKLGKFPNAGQPSAIIRLGYAFCFRLMIHI